MPEREEQVAHALARAKQRYGVNFSRQDYEDTCDAVRYGAARLVLTQRPGREVWEVPPLPGRIKRTRLVAVWDTRRELIVTFLSSACVPGQKGTPQRSRR